MPLLTTGCLLRKCFFCSCESHLFHPPAQSHPCRCESRCCPQTVCPSWSAYTPHTPFKKRKHQSGQKHIQNCFPDSKYDVSVCRLTSSWCRHQGRWGTCHMWPRRRRAGCTHRPRTHTGPSRCTTSPGWTCRCQCVWSSCSSHPASPEHTDRSHSYRRHDLREEEKNSEARTQLFITQTLISPQNSFIFTLFIGIQ